MPIVAVIGISSKKKSLQSLNPFIRNFKNFDSAKFDEFLSRFSYNDSESLDVCFFNLHNHFLNCVNQHLPLRKRTQKETRFALKPWITNSMKKSINEKKRLCKLAHIVHPNQNYRKNKYNRYGKKLEKVIFSAERKYFSDKVDEFQNHCKSLWRIINQITKRKKNK